MMTTTAATIQQQPLIILFFLSTMMSSIVQKDGLHTDCDMTDLLFHCRCWTKEAVVFADPSPFFRAFRHFYIQEHKLRQKLFLVSKIHF